MTTIGTLTAHGMTKLGQCRMSGGLGASASWAPLSSQRVVSAKFDFSGPEITVGTIWPCLLSVASSERA